MLSRIKELEGQIEQQERQLKLKQSKLESLHPKLNQILEVKLNLKICVSIKK
jgi:hypothetical protein